MMVVILAAASVASAPGAGADAGFDRQIRAVPMRAALSVAASEFYGEWRWGFGVPIGFTPPLLPFQSSFAELQGEVGRGRAELQSRQPNLLKKPATA